MSTTYDLLQKYGRTVELTESSGRVTLDVVDDDGDPWPMPHLEVPDLVRIAFEMLKVASYIDDPSVMIREATKYLREGNNSWIADLTEQILFEHQGKRIRR